MRFETGGHSLDQAARQEFGIATFSWLHTAAVESAGMSVALVTVQPGQKWEPHRHSGYEQIVYVLAGQGRQAVDGEWHDLEPGTFRYLPDNITHALESTGPVPLRFLAVYSPVHVRLQMPAARLVPLGPDRPLDLRELIPVSTLQRIQDSLAEATGLGVMVVDDSGASVTEPSHLPVFCCLLKEGRDGCCRMLSWPTRRDEGGEADGDGRCRFFECCCGIVGLRVPICLDGVYLGEVVCGFVLLEPPRPQDLETVRALAGAAGLDPVRLEEAYLHVPVVLNTPLRAAAESLQTATSLLVELAAREIRERLLREYNERLAREAEVVRGLERNLADTQLKLLQAQFSPHFLFNALNMIASCIAAGEPEPERMVYALSDFLRYVLNSRQDLVPLREEAKCVQNYLTIQQGRFGSSMHIVLDVPGELGDVAVPSLLLQPLVENAVIHGLGPRNYEGCISICARRQGDHVAVEVLDDGVGLPEGLLIEAPHASLLPDSRVGGGLGLRLVRRKLELHYGREASLSISSERNTGTRVTIRLPARELTGEMGA
ncbi:MAG TPA: histidine kinase [Firmicutes bacterium]|nr:histidine kinase [Bacillota bacterium]